MFIAHIPAGYLIGRLCAYRAPDMNARDLVIAGMAGGFFPDTDLFYGAIVDGGSIHHHLYWTHLPLFWLGIHALMVVMLKCCDSNRFSAQRSLLTAFLLGIWSHLLLDSVAGDIWWWPWGEPFSLAHVASSYSPWWLNYLLHWTGLIEVVIVCSAITVERMRPVLFATQKWETVR